MPIKCTLGCSKQGATALLNSGNACDSNQQNPHHSARAGHLYPDVQASCPMEHLGSGRRCLRHCSRQDICREMLTLFCSELSAMKHLGPGRRLAQSDSATGSIFAGESSPYFAISCPQWCSELSQPLGTADSSIGHSSLQNRVSPTNRHFKANFTVRPAKHMQGSAHPILQ